jgi:hypothetical protein
VPAVRQGALVLGVPYVPAELLDHELHPVALLVLVIAPFLEHAQHRFAHSKDLRRRQEFVDDARRLAHDRRSAASQNAESALTIRAELRMEGQIVDRNDRVIFWASFERDLELPRQRRAEAVAKQKPSRRFRVRRDVEPFVGSRTGVRAGRDVPHRVAARLAGGDAGIGQQPHRRFGIVQLDEMKLNILARRDVAEPARVALADLGQHAQLRARDDALRDLDAQHLGVGRLTLSVSAPQQTKRAPLVRRHFTALVFLEHGHELVNVGLIGK